MIGLTKPKNWSEAALGEIAAIERTSVAAQNIELGTKYIGLEHLDSDGRILAIQTVNNGDLASNKFVFGPAHILYGKLRPYLRKIVRAEFDGICSTDIIPIRATKVDRGYLFHYLRHPRVVEYATGRCEGANLPRISPSEIEKFPIHFPPSLLEQRRIADILDKADAIRWKRQKAIKLSAGMIESAFYHFFGDTWTNNRKWPEGTLEDLCDKIIDCPHSTPIYSNTRTGYYCVRSSDIQEDKIDLSSTLHVKRDVFEERIRRHSPISGEVVYTREGGRLGNAAQVPPDLSICLGQRMMLFSAKPMESTNEFIWALLNSPGTKRQVNYLTAHTAPRINIADIRLFKVVLPPCELQKQYSQIVSRVRDKDARYAGSASACDDLFHSLAQRAFRGEL